MTVGHYSVKRHSSSGLASQPPPHYGLVAHGWWWLRPGTWDHLSRSTSPTPIVPLGGDWGLGLGQVTAGTGVDDADSSCVIMHDGDVSSSSVDSERAEDKTPPPRLLTGFKLWRHLAHNALHSLKAQVLIVSIVVVTLLVDLTSMLGRLHPLGMSQSQQLLFAQTTYFVLLALLAAQQLEMIVKFCVWQLDVCKERLELFDVAVIVATLSLAIVFGARDYQADGVALLIALRLWRVHNICKAMMGGVRAEYERRLGKERRSKRALEREVGKLRKYCLQQECELQMYRCMLHDNNIAQPTVLRPPTAPRTLNVIVEVNEGGAHGAAVDHTDDMPPDYAQTMHEYVPLEPMPQQQHSPALSS